MGRVCRVVGLSAPAPVYDRADPRSPVIARVHDGDLIVVFDDPGKYRQILTANQTFGYIAYSVKLKKMDLFPNEVFNMKSAAVRTEAPVEAAPTPPAANSAPVSAAPAPVKLGGLTSKQLTIAAVLFVGVFAAMFIVLMQFEK